MNRILPRYVLGFLLALFVYSCSGNADTAVIRGLVRDFRTALEANDIATASRMMPGGDFDRREFIQMLLAEIPSDGSIKISSADGHGRYRIELASFSLEAVRTPEGGWVLAPYMLRSQSFDFIPGERQEGSDD